MKKYIIVILGLISICGFGQTKLEINGFSEKYKGVLTIEKGFENEVFKKGNITIIELKMDKKVVDIDSEEFTFELDNKGRVKTDVLELPYGEQGIIISEDFNFDGIDDLAVMDGQHSCYHGPSFQVYLDVDNKLEFSPEFSRLAHEYCGMFKTDFESKTIQTMTKSGCCWHQLSKFKVVNNIPIPILVIEEDATNFPFYTTSITEWNENEKTEKVEKKINLNQEDITEVFSFELVKNKKRVVIFNINDRTLNYVLIRSNETVEFSYPIKTVFKNPDFEFDENEEYLTFRNQDAVYKIYETHNRDGMTKMGILVQVDGKLYDLKGSPDTVNGSLTDIKKIKLDNVVLR